MVKVSYEGVLFELNDATRIDEGQVVYHGTLVDMDAATVEVNDYDEAEVDGWREDETVDVILKCGEAKVSVNLSVKGHGYHHNGRNAHGEWVEPEENGWICEHARVNRAYLNDVVLEDIEVTIGDDVVEALKEVVTYIE